MSTDRSKDRVVYSTQKPAPSKAPVNRLAEPTTPPPGLSARVQREKAHRAGRWVTVVYELELPDTELARLCTKLKKLCATGGTVKEGRIEIQGDHAVKLVAALANMGIRARRSGA